MTQHINKDDSRKRVAKINKAVFWSTVVFTIGLILHLYVAIGDWSFITGFFSTNPIPWIMLLFVALIVYGFYATYIYLRKHL